MQTVSVLGTGEMGSAMAQRLLAREFRVHVWNRTHAKAATLAADGAVVFDSPGEAVRTADVVIVVVFDASAVLDVLGQISENTARDTVVLISATVGLDIATIIESADRLGLKLIDAPVLGNPGPASRGELTVMVAGSPGCTEKASAVFQALASQVIAVADKPGAASRLKLIANTWVLGTNTVASQAVALSQALDVDPALFISAVAGTEADSAYLHAKRSHLLGERDDVITPVDATLKDLGLIHEAAKQAGASTLLIDTLLTLSTLTAQAGLGGRDMTELRRALQSS